MSGDTARALSETLLIQFDVDNAQTTLKLMASLQCEPPETLEHLRVTLFRDAVVQFVACFEKNPFALVVAQVYGRANGGVEYFQWLKDIRNAYAAHRYGAARQCAVGLLADDAGTLLGIGHNTGTYAPDMKAIPDIIAFIEIARKFTAARVSEWEAKLKDEATAMSAKERLALPTAKVHGMDPAEIKLSRNKLSEKRNTS